MYLPEFVEKNILRAEVVLAPYDPLWVFALCFLFVFLFSADRFRHAVVPLDIMNGVRKARVLTTPLRFYSMAAVYVFINLSIFYVLCRFPEEVKKLAEQFGFGGDVTGVVPVGVFVVMYVLLYSDSPKLMVVDDFIRRFLQRLSSIPTKLVVFIENLDGCRLELSGDGLLGFRRWYAARYGDCIGEPLFGRGGGAPRASLVLDGEDLKGQWLRCCYLHMLVAEWRRSASVFNKFYMMHQEAVEDLLSSMRAVEGMVERIFSIRCPISGGAPAPAAPGGWEPPSDASSNAARNALGTLLRRQHAALGCALFSKWLLQRGRERFVRSLGFVRRGERVVSKGVLCSFLCDEVCFLVFLKLFVFYPAVILVALLAGKTLTYGSILEPWLKWPLMMAAVAVAATISPVWLASWTLKPPAVASGGEAETGFGWKVVLGFPLLSFSGGWAAGTVALMSVETLFFFLGEDWFVRARQAWTWGLYCGFLSMWLWFLFRLNPKIFVGNGLFNLRGILSGVLVGLVQSLVLLLSHYVRYYWYESSIDILKYPEPGLLFLATGFSIGFGLGWFVPGAYWSLFEKQRIVPR